MIFVLLFQLENASNKLLDYVANFQTGYYLTKGIVIFVDSEFLRRPLLGEIRYSGRIGFKFLLDK